MFAPGLDLSDAYCNAAALICLNRTTSDRSGLTLNASRKLQLPPIPHHLIGFSHGLFEEHHNCSKTHRFLAALGLNVTVWCKCRKHYVRSEGMFDPFWVRMQCSCDGEWLPKSEWAFPSPIIAACAVAQNPFIGSIRTIDPSSGDTYQAYYCVERKSVVIDRFRSSKNHHLTVAQLPFGFMPTIKLVPA